MRETDPRCDETHDKKIRRQTNYRQMVLFSRHIPENAPLLFSVRKMEARQRRSLTIVIVGKQANGPEPYLRIQNPALSGNPIHTGRSHGVDDEGKKKNMIAS